MQEEFEDKPKRDWSRRQKKIKPGIKGHNAEGAGQGKPSRPLKSRMAWEEEDDDERVYRIR